MNHKYSLPDYCKLAVYYVGWAASLLVVLALIFAGIIKIGSAIANPHLSKGYVTAKAYNDGHYWYSTYTLGDFTINKRHGGEPFFYITVSDGNTNDFWTIPEEQWELVNVGQYVTR